MGKIREIFHGPHRRFAWYVVISTVVFIVLWLIGPGNTFINWAKAGIEISRQERVIREYEEMNAELDRRIRQIRTDRDTLEKFAREQFRFAVPGEDVYIIEE